MKSSKLHFTSDLPNPATFPKQTFLIYDRRLETLKFKTWIRKFPYRMAVSSGEGLKNLSLFPKFVESFAKKSAPISSRQMNIVVFGGGTVTDFAGFLASVYKRGLQLHLIPSTWLSAVDSAHGGKNALNLGSLKNQIGTIYFPSDVWLVKSVLKSQPAHLEKMALSEVLKIFLLQDALTWKKISKEKKPDLWKYLKPAIEGKIRIVKKDPYELKGLRHQLNLGHSLGHILEAQLGWPHGEAVLYGLVFDLIWSRHGRKISESNFEKIIQSDVWVDLIDPARYQQLFKIKDSQVQKLLAADKKVNSKGMIQNTFLTGVGKAKVTAVPMNELIQEFQRQKARMSHPK